jgi:DNA-binding MarR family transcriptional regulator
MARATPAGSFRSVSRQPPTELCSCSAVRQAARHLSRLYDEALAPAGVSLNQYSILAKLERFGPQTMAQLAERLIMERSTLGHLLRPLQKRGLVRIRTAPEDGRRRLVSLDRPGSALLRAARPLWAGAERQFERAFGAHQAASLRQLMQAVTGVELS